MANAAIVNLDSEIISRHGFAEVIKNRHTGQNSLHALVPFKNGEMICRFSAADVFTEPNYLTVQREESEHITLEPSFLQYTNHSCSPNVFFDTCKMEVIAIKNIDVNDELCFFYPSTELEMAQPFICYCGSGDCLQNIRGARHLPADILSKYQLTSFIRQQLQPKP